MSREVSLTEQEIEQVRQRLSGYRQSLDDDEAQLLQLLLNKVDAEAEAQKSSLSPGLLSSPGWVFSWTYRF
ncbi:hypothetical protein Lepto7375DRAFT_6983 [Leptolyngbya sp. PCC 7375]|nr:hypothetical protein Lepto7375DRAFT_6983 [Leptolyngbya sp. PCC 7375]